MLHVEQELLTFPEQLSSPPIFSGVHFCVMFCRWLYVLFVLTIALCVLLRFTTSLVSSNIRPKSQRTELHSASPGNGYGCQIIIRELQWDRARFTVNYVLYVRNTYQMILNSVPNLSWLFHVVWLEQGCNTDGDCGNNNVHRTFVVFFHLD